MKSFKISKSKNPSWQFQLDTKFKFTHDFCMEIIKTPNLGPLLAVNKPGEVDCYQANFNAPESSIEPLKKIIKKFVKTQIKQFA